VVEFEATSELAAVLEGIRIWHRLGREAQIRILVNSTGIVRISTQAMHANVHYLPTLAGEEAGIAGNQRLVHPREASLIRPPVEQEAGAGGVADVGMGTNEGATATPIAQCQLPLKRPGTGIDFDSMNN
jgi:hypothetical protein